MITSDIALAANEVRSGGVIGLPTETVYGLAAGVSHPKAIERIFVLKKRPFFDPLIVHLASFGDVQKVASEFNLLHQSLAQQYWPGPLTLVLPKAPQLNPMITSGLETVGVRMPNHPIALDLIKTVGEPVAAPSANLFSKVSPTQAQHVEEVFSELVILDGGPCQIGIESTVIGFAENEILIHRPGAITEVMLNNFLKDSQWSEYRVRATPSKASPGQIEHHYMPQIPLVILPEGATPDEPLYKNRIQSRFADFFNKPNPLNLPDDATLAARRLYEELRVKSKGASGLWFSPSKMQKDVAWAAIWDRLNKASSLKI